MKTVGQVEPDNNIYHLGFHSPIPGHEDVIYLFQSRRKVISEVNLDVLTKMPLLEFILEYLTRVPLTDPENQELALDAHDSHVLISNFVEDLKVGERLGGEDWRLIIKFRSKAEGEYLGEMVEPLSVNEQRAFFQYFGTITQQCFIRRAVDLALQFYSLIHNSQGLTLFADKEKPMIMENKSGLNEATINIPGPGSFKRSSVIVEQISKYSYPVGKKQKQTEGQLSLFDTLDPSTRGKIINAGVKQRPDEVAEWVNKRGLGIKLTRAEYKLLLCIASILDKKSKTHDPSDEDYFTGNADPHEVLPADKLIGKVNLRVNITPRTVHDQTNEPLVRKTATLLLTLYEITKEYVGGDRVGNFDMKDVLDLLTKLATDPQKRMLLKYRREQVIGDKKIVDTIEGFEPMLNVYNYNRQITSLSNEVISSATKIVIRLHPIFIDQIDKKYVEYPDDILPRIYAVNGGKKDVSEVTYRLIDYLAHSRSNKLYTAVISVDKLYWKLAEDWMANPKRGRGFIKKYIDKAIEHAKDVDLLLGWKIEKNKKGEFQYHFKINSKWC